MDASFSPILRVAYRVENARVEQRTDLDKLVMNIETNGAILPEEALRQAAHILQDQLSVFGGLPTIGLEPVAPQPGFRRNAATGPCRSSDGQTSASG